MHVVPTQYKKILNEKGKELDLKIFIQQTYTMIIYIYLSRTFNGRNKVVFFFLMYLTLTVWYDDITLRQCFRSWERTSQSVVYMLSWKIKPHKRVITGRGGVWWLYIHVQFPFYQDKRKPRIKSYVYYPKWTFKLFVLCSFFPLKKFPSGSCGPNSQRLRATSTLTKPVIVFWTNHFVRRKKDGGRRELGYPGSFRPLSFVVK